MGILKEVTKGVLYDFIANRDIVISSEGDYPYTIVYKDRGGNIVGKAIPCGKHIGVSSDKYKYYLIETDG